MSSKYGYYIVRIKSFKVPGPMGPWGWGPEGGCRGGAGGGVQGGGYPSYTIQSQKTIEPGRETTSLTRLMTPKGSADDGKRLGAGRFALPAIACPKGGGLGEGRVPDFVPRSAQKGRRIPKSSLKPSVFKVFHKKTVFPHVFELIWLPRFSGGTCAKP